MTTSSEPPSQPPIPPTPRFQIELEFVLALANPDYLQYLGVTTPHLFNPSEDTDTANAKPSAPHSKSTPSLKAKKDNSNSDAICFARYLKYLLDYWRTPEYAQYLTHPAATIRNLELLQNEQFRRDITHPALRERLAEGFAGFAPYVPPVQEQAQDSEAAEDADQTNGDGNSVAGRNGVAAGGSGA